jgi:hypothetical protein
LCQCLNSQCPTSNRPAALNYILNQCSSYDVEGGMIAPHLICENNTPLKQNHATGSIYVSGSGSFAPSATPWPSRGSVAYGSGSASFVTRSARYSGYHSGSLRPRPTGSAWHSHNSGSIVPHRSFRHNSSGYPRLTRSVRQRIDHQHKAQSTSISNSDNVEFVSVSVATLITTALTSSVGQTGT